MMSCIGLPVAFSTPPARFFLGFGHTLWSLARTRLKQYTSLTIYSSGLFKFSCLFGLTFYNYFLFATLLIVISQLRLCQLWCLRFSIKRIFYSILYLSERSQMIITNNSRTRWVHAKLKVPQGSVLGPLLFVLYTADISHSST